MLTPFTDGIEPFAFWENGFNDKELSWLQEKAAKSDQKAGIAGVDLDEESLTQIRRSHISWMNCTPETKWVFNKLANVVSSLNSQFYRFDLTGFGEPLQFTNYDQSENGMYHWHQDHNNHGGISRKLSVVLQLTDPAQYEGGNLQIMSSGNPITVRKQRGLIAVFPSYTFHQVTPVTQGSRQSLVAWLSGPAFR